MWVGLRGAKDIMFISEIAVKTQGATHMKTSREDSCCVGNTGCVKRRQQVVQPHIRVEEQDANRFHIAVGVRPFRFSEAESWKVHHFCPNNWKKPDHLQNPIFSQTYKN